MENNRITSPAQMDKKINVTKPGSFIVLGILLILVIAMFVAVFTVTMERKSSVWVHCEGEIDYQRIQEYFTDMLNSDDGSSYEVLDAYLNELDDSGEYVLYDTVMPEAEYSRFGIATGSKARFDNGIEGVVVGGTMAGEYEELSGEYFHYTSEELDLMEVYPGKEPYCMVYIFTGRQDEGQSGSHVKCDIVTQSVTLSNILFEGSNE